MYILGNIIKSLKKSILAKNILSLYLLQLGNYLLPLITIPYLVRILGPEKFGLVAFIQGFISYFVIFVNYGFNRSITRKISVIRANIDNVSKVAANVWAAKFLLSIISFLFLIIIAHFSNRLKENESLILIMYGIVIGHVIFPTWLFIGLEKISEISLINIIVRIIFTLSIFLFIKNQSDYVFYALLITFQWILSGILSVIYAFKKLKIKFQLPSLPGIIQTLREGWTLFLATGAIKIYTTGNTFILGLLTNSTMVGYYVPAEKLVRAIQGLLDPISQAVFPRASKMAADSTKKALVFSKKIIILMGFIGGLFSIGILLFAPILVKILFGNQYEKSIVILRILSIIPLAVAISNVLGIQTMIPLGLDTLFTKLLIFNGFLSIGFAIFLTYFFNVIGMAFSTMISEVIISIMMFVVLWKKDLNPLKSIMWS